MHTLNRILVFLDGYLDYVPFVSTATNLTALFLQRSVIPSLPTTDHLYTYIKEKSEWRCTILLVPFLGNGVILLKDGYRFFNYQKAMRRIHDFDSEVMSLYTFGLGKVPPELWRLTHVTCLNLDSNDLPSLPTEIGLLTNLTNLNIETNRFNSIPTEIGQLTKLQYLYLAKNRLTSLPREIGQLTKLDTLYLYMNKLTTLPEEIGLLTSLQYLLLWNNSLNYLPAQMGNMRSLNRLDLNTNENLRELPLSLGQISELCEINIDRTGINQANLYQILDLCRLMRSEDAQTDAFPARLAKWKEQAKSAVDIDRIAALPVAQKIEINEWLVRLEVTKDFSQAQTALATIVCNILADLHQFQDFKELFFSQIAVNNACCQDRAAMALNELYTSWVIMCRTALPLQLLTGVAKTLCLRKEIAKRLPANERESVEIYLYYETKLHNELQLVTAITNMAYATIGERHWIDEESLIEDVNRNFFEELFELPIFQKMIENKWDAEFQQKLEDLGPCPNGRPEDEEVLNYQHSQGQIMAEWRRAKMKKAKEWYESY